MRTAIPVLVLLALLGTGCGNSSDQSSSTSAVTAALVHAAFADKADRICSDGRKRLILSGNHYFGDLRPEQKPSDATVTAFAQREAIPILSHQYAKLRALTPPPGDQKTIDRILALAETGIGQLRADPTLLNQGSGIPPALQRARHRAFNYGLGSCGQPLQSPRGAGG